MDPGDEGGNKSDVLDHRYYLWSDYSLISFQITSQNWCDCFM